MDIININYKIFEKSYLNSVMELQNEWCCEDITFGIVPDSADNMLNYASDYFWIAVDVLNNDVIGYITAEIINKNEFNIFPKDSEYLRVNDLYVKSDYRNNKIGEKLLSIVEQQANKNGINNIFISSATKDYQAVINFYTRNGYGVWTNMFYKRTHFATSIFELGELKYYKFVVIFALYKDKWILCRHKERDTYETPGGHIEHKLNETPFEAAKRELIEETGAVDFDIKPIFDYSVYTAKSEDFSDGQVYFANVKKFGNIPDYSEIAEIKLFDSETIEFMSADKMTYPLILPILFKKVKEEISI